MTKKTHYKSFSDFWPYYLSQHTLQITQVLHAFGLILAIGLLGTGIITQNYLVFLAVPLVGYLPAWFGHFVFEKNRPATFSNPFYSILGDFKLLKRVLFRK